jgi:hypothetical protein
MELLGKSAQLADRSSALADLNRPEKRRGPVYLLMVLRSDSNQLGKPTAVSRFDGQAVYNEEGTKL